MKFLHKAKDGGIKSNVTGYWLIESKKFFSIVLLRFDEGSREAFHTHAFNAISWVIKGEMHEHTIHGEIVKLTPSVLPIYTSRKRFHKVYGIAKSTWALSFRGPWVDTWKEFLPNFNKYITLTHGRKILTK
jgi:hypothetical protein